MLEYISQQNLLNKTRSPIGAYGKWISSREQNCEETSLKINNFVHELFTLRFWKKNVNKMYIFKMNW